MIGRFSRARASSRVLGLRLAPGRFFEPTDAMAVIRQHILEKGHLVVVVLLHGVEAPVHAFAEAFERLSHEVEPVIDRCA